MLKESIFKYYSLLRESTTRSDKYFNALNILKNMDFTNIFLSATQDSEEYNYAMDIVKANSSGKI